LLNLDKRSFYPILHVGVAPSHCIYPVIPTTYRGYSSD